RQREESITKTAELLRAENESLKSEIVQLREMITDLRKQLSSTCQAPVPTDPMRESGNITRSDSYMPYHTFQLGFSINSQL
ncbi:BZIP domain-containing protein, partial [Trichostrongylus colubriformis]